MQNDSRYEIAMFFLLFMCHRHISSQSLRLFHHITLRRIAPNVNEPLLPIIPEKKKVCSRCGREQHVLCVARFTKACFSLARIFNQRTFKHEIRIICRLLPIRMETIVKTRMFHEREDRISCAIDLYEMSLCKKKRRDRENFLSARTEEFCGIDIVL